MSFAETYTAIEKQRVKSSARRLGSSNGCRMGKPVGISNNESVEGVFRVETEALGSRW